MLGDKHVDERHIAYASLAAASTVDISSQLIRFRSSLPWVSVLLHLTGHHSPVYERGIQQRRPSHELGTACWHA
jgi:hypothetical protein